VSGRDGGEYTLRVLERVRDVPRETWDGLLTDDSSPFVEHTWLDCLEEAGCTGADAGWVPAHLSLWRGDALVAAAPSYVKGNSEGEFVFDWSWAEAAQRIGIRYYPKIVVAVPFTPATGDRVLVAPGEDRGTAARLLATAAREWAKRVGASGVHALFLREAEADAWEESGYLRRDGFQFQWFRRGATSFDEYLARFTSKQRNQIKREIRGVEGAGVRVEPLEPTRIDEAAARMLHLLYASTVDRFTWGRMYLNERFFQLVAERFRDRLAPIVARDDRGEIVAAAFNVSGKKRLYGRYWGARVEVPYLHFVVCYYAGIRYCLERGLDVFEPGAGGEHKRPRGFVPTITRSAHWLADVRMRQALAPYLARERERVAELVLTEP
jgi:predicted N-acyltransferase